MKTGDSLWRGEWGRLGFSALIAGGIVWLIWHFGDRIGLHTTLMKSLVLAGALFLLMMLRHSKTMSLVIQQSWHRLEAKRKNALPADESRVAQTAPRTVTVDAIRLTLRNLHGRCWARKTRILLITGAVDEVEQLTPGLPDQLWQEDRGTLLLWGGDLNSPADIAWLTALRKLRRRPVDGVVWVTRAFDQLSAPGLEQRLSLPSESIMDPPFHAIRARMDALGWKLPLYVWSLHTCAGKPEGRITQATGCLLPAGCHNEALTETLTALTPVLISQGLQQTCSDINHHFLLTLADQLSRRSANVTALLSVMLNSSSPLSLAGLVFSQPSAGTRQAAMHHWRMDKCWDVLPASVQMLPADLRPRKPGIPWQKIMASCASLTMVGWAAWICIAYIANYRQVADVNAQAALAVRLNQSPEQRMKALTEFQHTLARLEHRSEHGVPWYQRAGLSQNEKLRSALWPRYLEAAQPLLRDAAAAWLTGALQTYAALPPDSPLRETQSKQAYVHLRLYLMLTRPERMDASWFSQTLMQNRTQRQGLDEAYWQGAGETLLAFYAEHLITHPEWALKADPDLVGQVRTLLVRQMGVTNSESRQYQRVISKVKRQYADMRLADMTGDTDAARLFITDEIVPGMFTRQAWEEGVKPAIEKVARERREEMDWVLSDAPPPAGEAASPEALEARLASRYFADYSAAWLHFLNSLRLQPAPTLSDAIDQLTLIADVRQSPLVALMNTLNVQGRTAQSGGAMSDSLVKSAQNLFNREKRPVIDQRSGPQGPLDATFGPLLALTDNQSSSTMNLRTFLTRVTQVRLRLQQVTSAADPQAMTQALARTVFQGKSVDLTETRDYGSLVAAGLGQEWSGFGQTVFVRPIEQAWQQVLMPAAGSFNAQWQQAVVNEWNRAFGGRYPFKNVSSEVSLPLLAKYLNADTGRLTRFLHARLSGVLHREGTRWVPDRINARGLTFNPAFLRALNQLSQIADVVFASGHAGLHFELRPGTAADVMQTDLIIDSQKLTYMNQQPVWRRFIWPADTDAPGASLSWISTKAGTRLYGEMPGSWGLIRLLEKAHVSARPGLGSSWQLTWHAPDGRPLNYILRTEAGEGPLALLKLRNFTLPSDIFLTSSTQNPPGNAEFIEEE
ncbi:MULTISPECIES: ImcF-related family protein [Pantoea]|uniref:ImcF-related family protein n=1 Tax=Pantoea TaxID=53335 RepID=UPI002592EEC0|nr:MULTISPECIES: ImcF-related family protein [Pantoea]